MKYAVLSFSAKLMMALAVCACEGCLLVSSSGDGCVVESGETPLIQAHRGGRAEYDDNAAGGFATSYANGIRGFETDVRFTADRKLVIMHDVDVTRTTWSTGRVETLTFKQFRAARLKRSNEPAATLDDLLKVFAGKDDIFVEFEMKAYPGGFYTPEVLTDYCRQLNAAVKAVMKPGTYAFTSFNIGTLETMRTVDPASPRCLIYGKPLKPEHIAKAKELGCLGVSPLLKGTTKEMVDAAHAAGLKVALWMVQTPEQYAEAKAKGADRITSDWPCRLKRALTGSETTFADFGGRCRAAATVAGEVPSLLPEGRDFRLVWNDEFNGDQLDESKWGYRTNFWGARFKAFAAPEDQAVEVKGGKVHLKLVKRGPGDFCCPQLQSGALLWDMPYGVNKNGFWPFGKREKAKFVHRYGYYECRFKLQEKNGWWSAFWMQTESQGASLDPEQVGIEQDIMESFNPGVVVRHCFHMNGYGADYRGFCTPRKPKDRPDYGQQILDVKKYHTYGLLWEPDGYTVFIDGRQHGEKVGRGPGEAVAQCPEFILISTEPRWYRQNRMTGAPSPWLEEAVGDEFVVDYVRVYDVR